MDNPYEFKYPKAKDIEDMRKSAGLTQQKLAELSGVSSLTLSRIENSDYEHNITTMCKVLGTLQLCNVIHTPDMTPDPFDFIIPTGEELWTLRKDLGLSRGELSRMAEVNSNIILNLELRSQNAMEKSYMAIIEALQEAYDTYEKDKKERMKNREEYE